MSPVIPSIAWDDFLASADTGDIMLFSGDSDVSTVVEVFTFGSFSHSGMVVVRDGEKYLWQECSEVLYSDPIPGKAHAGAQLGDLGDTVAYISSLGDAPTYRQLQWDRTDAFRDAVATFCDDTDGRPFPPLYELAWKYVEGLAGIPRLDGTIFCSMLVAMTYQAGGLLPATPPANSYCPTDLSSERPALPLTVGTLLVDQPIDMTGVPIPPPPTTTS